MHEDTSTPDSRAIVEILASENPKATLKEAVHAALSGRIAVALNEYKKEIAKNYFGQPKEPS